LLLTARRREAMARNTNAVALARQLLDTIVTDHLVDTVLDDR
jgi:hypothetical protein